MGELRDFDATGGAALRRGLPTPLPDEIRRQRLIDHLADRWNRTVTLVEAPGGYGKSTALAQGVRDNTEDPSGTDVYVCCRRSDADPMVFTRTIVDALRPGGRLTASMETTALATAITDQLAAAAPHPISLILDDVHLLIGAADTVAVLSAVIRDLPTNAHLVLVGRLIPDVPLARLRSQLAVTHLERDELRFDPSELSALATLHGADASALANLHGWPAMTRLAVAAGRDVSTDYLREEVVGALDPKTRAALGAVIVGRRVDDAALDAATTGGVTTAELLERVPLLMELDDGSIVAHDLWSEVLDEILPPDEQRPIAEVVATAHLESGRIDECLEIQVGARNWDGASAAIMRALEASDAVLGFGTTERWLSMFPEHELARPELRLLSAVDQRLRHGPAAGTADVDAALDAFAEAGHEAHLAVAVIESGMRAGLMGDMETLARNGKYVADLAEAGNPHMQALALLGRTMRGAADDIEATLFAEMEIDFDRQVPHLAPILLRSRSSMAFTVGRGDIAVAAIEELNRRLPVRSSEIELAFCHWQNGDPALFLDLPMSLRQRRRDSARDVFIATFFNVLADAGLGISHGMADGMVSTTGAIHDRVQQTFAQVAERLCEGDEPAARELMNSLLDDVGLDPPPVREFSQRFTAYAYLTDARLRDHLEQTELGPRFQRNRAISRTLHQARQRAAPRWDDLPEPPEILCSLPLPWSVELACHATSAGHASGPALIEFLLEVAGSRSYEWLRRFRDDHGTLADGAATLTTRVPPPPADVARISVFGETTIAHGQQDVEAIRQSRVRQVLAALVLNGRTDRSALAAWLWPDLDKKSSSNNLRVALARLRSALEPRRQRGEPAFQLRQDGDDLWLHRSEHLVVDAWVVEDLLADGEGLAARDPSRSAAAFAAAALGLTDRPFRDLREVSELADALTEWDHRMAVGLAKAAQWALADNRVDDACRLAEQLLALDQWNESAHQVRISAALLAGDLAAAGGLVKACRTMLDELEVPPSPETALLFRRVEHRTVPPS